MGAISSVSTLQTVIESLRADLDIILEDRVLESKAPSAEPAEDTVLASLFATFEIPPPPPREHAKRRKGREEDNSRARKKERREMEPARRASLADEKAHQIRAIESAAGASSSRDVETAGGTSDSAVDDEDTTEGVHITYVVVSREPDSQACLSLMLCALGSLHLPLSFFSFFCIGDNCISFCWRWGKWKVSGRLKSE